MLTERGAFTVLQLRVLLHTTDAIRDGGPTGRRKGTCEENEEGLGQQGRQSESDRVGFSLAVSCASFDSSRALCALGSHHGSPHLPKSAS